MKKNNHQSKRDKIEALMNAVPNTAALFYGTTPPPAGSPSETREAAKPETEAPRPTPAAGDPAPAPSVVAGATVSEPGTIAAATLETLRQSAKNAVPMEKKKTRRVHLIISPSLFEAVKISAQMEGLSLNEYAARALAAAATATAATFAGTAPRQ